jgi:hypothetical protein
MWVTVPRDNAADEMPLFLFIFPSLTALGWSAASPRNPNLEAWNPDSGIIACRHIESRNSRFPSGVCGLELNNKPTPLELLDVGGKIHSYRFRVDSR